jgi:secreted trypsin-like serine protease
LARRNREADGLATSSLVRRAGAVVAVAVSATAGGCGGEVASVAPTTDAAVATSYAASGYILHDRSSIEPWCGAVLVAPDLAATAAHCIAGESPATLAVGFGAIGSGATYRVVDAHVHPGYRRTESEHDLAVLVLARDVVGVRPAHLAPAPAVPPGAVVNTAVVSYRFADRGASTPDGRAAIAGRVVTDADDLALGAMFPPAEINCHGESGAGLFVQSDTQDALLGVVTHVGRRGTDGNPACADTLYVAPVADYTELLATVRGGVQPR